MHPFASYTELKTVHDQDIKEMIERQYSYTEQEEPKQGLFQMVGTFLARFNNRPLDNNDSQEMCANSQELWA